jgi:hypothetical protein
MQIQHPTAGMIARSATAQDDIVGDGTTSNVLLIGEMMKLSQRLVQEQVHPRIITEGLEIGRKEALKFLEEFKISRETIEKPLLVSVARTALCTKLHPDLANQLVDIKFKGNLHIVKFQNPTNWCYGVMNVDDNKVDILNNFNWILLGDNSPLTGRIENYVRGKYNVDSIMFIQYLKAENGTHFEIGYLDPKGVFHTAYLLYIPANDAFTDDTQGSFAQKSFESDKYIDPVPKDLEGSLVSFLTQSDKEVIAVLSYVSLSPRSFAVIGICGGRRWQIVVNWVQEKWVVISKQPYNDGFFVATGVPSVSAASCTGFVKKLYPVVFAKKFLYVSIETKSVGVSLSTRIVYNVEGKAFEVTVSTTYGVQRSHVLQSYLPVVFVKPAKDYGYGTENNINYGVDAAELYNQEAKESNLSKEPAAPAVVTVNPPAEV